MRILIVYNFSLTSSTTKARKNIINFMQPNAERPISEHKAKKYQRIDAIFFVVKYTHEC